jgi:GDP-L-fucose synthase
MKESYLFTGILEPTCESYAMAKLAGMSMCKAYNIQYGTHYISVIPPNLYGPNDNFDPIQSHMMGSFIQKFHAARIDNLSQVTVYGTGSPRRELMYVDDVADASIFLLQNYDSNEAINIGVGEDRSIRELAETVMKVVGYSGRIIFDSSKPDGAPRKLLDTSLVQQMGWKPQTCLEEGLVKTYDWYVNKYSNKP